MRCPHCFHPETAVVDSRVTSDADSIRRRRECCACTRRFTTYEHAEDIPLTVIKRDGQREPFLRDKLLTGILHACNKRPVSQEQIQTLANQVELTLRKTATTPVQSSHIGSRVAEELKQLDPVAYVRYTSVWRQFSQPKQFALVIQKLAHEKRRKTPCKQLPSLKNAKT